MNIAKAAPQAAYDIANPDEIVSPGLVVFPRLVERNVDEMLRIAGGPARLRPHCKTHKMGEIIRLLVGRGITKHKCATIAEAEMLADAGATDVLIAFPIVGPNIGRLAALITQYPNVDFSVTADHPDPVDALDRGLAGCSRNVGVLVDIDTGLGRTGLTIGPAVDALYQRIADCANLVPAGLHVYDGQNHQTDLADRRAAVDTIWAAVTELRDRLIAKGLPVPRVVAGGTISFPVLAALDDPGLELSPGTCVLHDAGYGAAFPDLDFVPAAVILTRVISRPAEDLVTFDLGHKACAADPPAGGRLAFPAIADAEEILQNEEHLVVRTSLGRDLKPGDWTVAIPVHICPTSALHRFAYAVEDAQVTAHWDVTARDRQLTI